MEHLGEVGERYVKYPSAFLLVIFLVGLIAGVMTTYYIFFTQINSLRDDILNLKAQVSKQSGFQNITSQTIIIYQNSTALSELYEKVRHSVVLIRGIASDGTVQGSGFVYNFSGTNVVITNYHVVHGTTSISVTFSNGSGYRATVKGTDPYADLAILSVDAPMEEFKPLEIINSSTLKVGDPVIAIGNPYGLVGSMTTGVISALGRTISEEYTGGFAIANVIQTSAPINPGNSGGPLLNYYGKVIGITTAIVADSQGLGFAIPSNTILREISALITTGTYEGHTYMGVKGRDMDYETARKMGVNVTYGWLIVEVTRDGPSYNKLQANDVITAMNGTLIRNGDELASYLEEKTLPGQALTLTVMRQNQKVVVTITLGRRPKPLI